MTKQISSGLSHEVDLPAGWAEGRFRKLFSFGKGLSITKDDLVEEGIPVISYGQIHSKNNTGTAINDSLIRFVPSNYFLTDKQALVYQGDFIFADTSEDLAGIGNCAFVNTTDTMFAGYHSIIARPKDTNICSKYFAYLFLTNFWRDQVRAKAMGVKVFSISQKLLRETTVLIPPKHEQTAIATFLDTQSAKLDSMVADIEKQIELLQKYKKSLITETVTKGLDRSVPMKDSGIEWIGKIPSHWSTNRLRYVASVKTGPFGTQLSADEYVDEGIPLINVKNIGYGNILAEDLDYVPKDVADRLSTHRLNLGDIVFGRKGAVDKHAIISDTHINWIQGSDCIRIRTISEIDANYLNFLFDSTFFRSYVMLFAVGTTMPSMNSDILLNAQILEPPIEEQRNIADYLTIQCDKINAIITNKRLQLETITQHKKSLIYEYVTGKKRVTKGN